MQSDLSKPPELLRLDICHATIFDVLEETGAEKKEAQVHLRHTCARRNDGKTVPLLSTVLPARGDHVDPAEILKEPRLGAGREQDLEFDDFPERYFMFSPAESLEG